MACAVTLGLEWDVLLLFAGHSHRSVHGSTLLVFKPQIHDAVEEFGKVTGYLRQGD